MIHLLMALSVLYLVPLVVWLERNGWTSDFRWHLFVFLPCAVALYSIWTRVEQAIRTDLKRCAAGEPMLGGLPHHGVFLLKSCALLLLFAVWIGKTVVAVREGLQEGVLVFGAGNVITNVLVIVAILVLCRLERGCDPKLDYDGRKVEAAA